MIKLLILGVIQWINPTINNLMSKQNNKKSSVKQMSNFQPRQKKYFKLLDKTALHSLIQKSDQKDSIKATVSLIRKNKFIYFDMNATNGFKAMQPNPQPQSDGEDQNFGSFVVCEGIKTSRQKIKLKQFMTINHKIRQRRDFIRSKVKEQLDKSKYKILLILDSGNNSNEKLKIYRNMGNQRFQSIKNTIQTEQINAEILKKQQKMMQKLGIISDFQSIKDRYTPSFVQKSKRAQKYFLPRILRPYN